MKKNLMVFLSIVCFAANAFAGRYLVLTNDTSSLAAKVAAHGGSVNWSHRSGIASVSGLDDASAAALAKEPGIGDVAADFGVALDDALAPESGSVLGPGSASAPQLASYYPRQWHLRAIGADAAWAAGRLGSPNVTVAICDTGIDYTHPDLVGRVDLSRSASFVPQDDALVAALYPGRHPVTDLNWHGTHVASNVSSNALYAAGVTSNVTLIGVKVLDRFGSGTFDANLAGVLWAADHGADVINLSIQGWFDRKEGQRYLAYIHTVFDYAFRQGAVVVTIAGNQHRDLDHDGNNNQAYCEEPNTICVSATGPLSAADANVGPWFDIDAPAFYSNYGRSAVSVAGPGGTLAGRVWGSCATTSLIVADCRANVQAVGVGGTSQAAPHVAGLAALLVEQLGRGNPAQVRQRIEQSADDLGEPGTDAFYGKGRINVPRALGLE